MGQLDGLTDNVFKHWMDHANLKELISIDLDASDNLTEETLFSFVSAYGSQLQGNSINIRVALLFFKNSFQNKNQDTFTRKTQKL